MPWYPPTQLEAEAAAQFLAAILESQQRCEALAGEDGAGLGGGLRGTPHRGGPLASRMMTALPRANRPGRARRARLRTRSSGSSTSSLSPRRE